MSSSTSAFGVNLHIFIPNHSYFTLQIRRYSQPPVMARDTVRNHGKTTRHRKTFADTQSNYDADALSYGGPVRPPLMRRAHTTGAEDYAEYYAASNATRYRERLDVEDFPGSDYGSSRASNRSRRREYVDRASNTHESRGRSYRDSKNSSMGNSYFRGGGYVDSKDSVTGKELVTYAGRHDGYEDDWTVAPEDSISNFSSSRSEVHGSRTYDPVRGYWTEERSPRGRS